MAVARQLVEQGLIDLPRCACGAVAFVYGSDGHTPVCGACARRPAVEALGASVTGSSAPALVTEALAALDDPASSLTVDRAAIAANAPLERDDTSALFDAAQQERSMALCPACGVSQEQHWQCACCTARGHHIPRSHVMPAYCAWCVAEGCAQAHALGRRTFDHAA